MRPCTPLAAALCLCACHSPPPAEVGPGPAAARAGTVVEAVLPDRAVATTDPAMPARHPDAAGTAPHVLAVDPVVAQLLRSAFATHAVQRRVALENLANVNTTAYKRRTVRLGTQLVQDHGGEPFAVPVVLGIEALFTSGVLEITERALDVAIDGEGFFAVLLADGTTGYTRDGGLCVDRDGKIVTVSGHVLLPQITIPSDTLEISIDPMGRFSGRTAGSPDTTTQFGEIALHRFMNPSGLRAIGANVLRSTDAAGAPVSGQPGTSGLGLLKQGFLERSNVQMADELVDLQVCERQHQSLTAVMRQFGMIAP